MALKREYVIANKKQPEVRVKYRAHNKKEAFEKGRNYYASSPWMVVVDGKTYTDRPHITSSYNKDFKVYGPYKTQEIRMKNKKGGK